MYTDTTCKSCSATIKGSAFQTGINQGTVKVAGLTLKNVMASGVARCPHCGGIQTHQDHTITEDTALRLVDFSKFGEDGNLDDQRYFDFKVYPLVGGAYRVHGWYNTVTGIMTQEG